VSLYIHLFIKVKLLLSWIIKLINELNCNNKLNLLGYNFHIFKYRISVLRNDS